MLVELTFVPWYGFPWWLSLGLIPWRFAFPVASVVGLRGFCFVCRVASLVFSVAWWSGGLALAHPFFCWLFCFCVVFAGFVWCSLAAALPSSAPPLVVLISGSEGFPSFVSVWISGCLGRLVCLHDLLSGILSNFTHCAASNPSGWEGCWNFRHTRDRVNLVRKQIYAPCLNQRIDFLATVRWTILASFVTINQRCQKGISLIHVMPFLMFEKKTIKLVRPISTPDSISLLAIRAPKYSHRKAGSACSMFERYRPISCPIVALSWCCLCPVHHGGHTFCPQPPKVTQKLLALTKSVSTFVNSSLLPSEPSEKRGFVKTLQNLGEELRFSIYYCKANPSKTKIGGPLLLSM